MEASKCFACKDLDYFFFEFEESFIQYPLERTGAKYMTIKRADLHRAISQGCQYCAILEEGCRAVWGREIDTVDTTNRKVLVLESHKGNGLQALWSNEDDIELSLVGFESRAEFFTSDSQPDIHPIFGPAVTVPTHLSCSAAADFMVPLLNSCEKGHGGCNISLTQLPKRVLDLSSDIVRLAEFQDGQAPNARYATMSHCWGKPEGIKPMMTTKSNLELMKTGIASGEIPTLFRDAIELCRMVGCQYIWIDSLCIIQDDVLDWAIQSKNMAEIYSNSYFNIAATSAPNCSHSLFQNRWVKEKDGIRHPPKTYQLKVSSFSGHIFVREVHNKDHGYYNGTLVENRSYQAPLLSRAWVFQEILLAPRTLFVCSSELIWECHGGTVCECQSIPSVDAAQSIKDYSSQPYKSHTTQFNRKQAFNDLLLSYRSITDIHNIWMKLCEHYSSLHLTQASDRTVAFEGMATATRSVTGGICSVGIWNDDILRGLFWGGMPFSDEGASRLPGVPTWSWMSRLNRAGTSHLTYMYILTDGFKAEKDTCTTVKVDGSELTFRGPTVLATLIFRETDEIGDMEWDKYMILINEAPHRPVLPSTFQFLPDCPTEDNLKGEDKVECLLLGTDESGSSQYVLVVKNICGDRNTYQRIGIAVLELGDPDEPGEVHDYFSNRWIKTISIC